MDEAYIERAGLAKEPAMATDPEDSETREPVEDAELTSDALTLVTGGWGEVKETFNFTFNDPVNFPTA
jgi:hypothetical protein